MTLGNPLGLLWLLAVPAVVVLHLFRRRLQERRVAGLFLFMGERLVADAGRTRTSLLHTPSLWLECLAAMALALWLAGLSLHGTTVLHVVFVLDDSASMGAGAAGKAAAAVRQRVAGLAGRDRVTLLRTGPRPEVLLGPAAPPSEVAAALRRWRPVRTRHDPLPAIDLARQLAAASGEVVFCTDEAPPPGCKDIDVFAFGESVPNCAILTARRVLRTDDAEGEDLIVRIAGYGAVAGCDLAVHAGEQELTRESLVLRDGQSDVRLRLPSKTGLLRLQLTADALPVDDVAWLLPAPDRTVAVCDLLAPELRQQLALPRVFLALSGFRREADPRAAQLVLATKPGLLRPGQIEVVFPPVDGERRGWRGPFVVDRSHGWLASVQLQGVVWVAGQKTLPGQVLVAVGAQALLSEEPVDVGRRLWIDLDPSAGNLVRSPDWPVLWCNLLDSARLEVPGVEQCNVLLGEEARYRRSLVAGAGDAELRLEGPDGQQTPGRGARTVGFVLEQPGLHRVLGAGDRELGQFAARFLDSSESDLRALATGAWPRTAVGAVATDGPVRGVEQQLLALLLLSFLLLDWWLLDRRRA